MVRYVAIPMWPYEETERRRPLPRPVSVDDVLARIENCAKRIDATLEIGIVMRAPDIKDGAAPKPGAKPIHPGVVLTIRGNDYAKELYTDRWIDWASNLLSIEVCLERIIQLMSGPVKGRTIYGGVDVSGMLYIEENGAK